LAFKALDKSGDGLLSREEFCRFYEVADLKWEPQIKKSGFEKRWAFCGELGVHFSRFVNHPYSDYLFSKILFLKG
jgi:hypothetical protein